MICLVNQQNIQKMQCSVRPLIQQLRVNEKSNNLYIELLKFENSKLIQETKFLYLLRELFRTHVNANIFHVTVKFQGICVQYSLNMKEFYRKRIFYSQLTKSYCFVIHSFIFTF